MFSRFSTQNTSVKSQQDIPPDLVDEYDPELDGINFGDAALREPIEVIAEFQSLHPPSHWQPLSFTYKDFKAPCYFSPAENEVAIVALVPGMNACPLEWTFEINILNAMGLSVISSNLLHTRDYDKYYRENRKFLRNLLWSQQDSPVYQYGREDSPIIAMLHSSSSPMFVDNVSRKRGLPEKPERLVGAVHLNSFWDTLSSSEDFFPIRSRLHGAFTYAYPHSPVGTTRAEKAYLYFGGGSTDHSPPTYGRPTNGRVRQMRDKSRTLKKKLLKGGRQDVSAFPQFVALGTHEECVCNPTAMRISDHLGVPHKTYNAGHFDLFKSPDFLTELKQRIEFMIAASNPQHSRSLSLTLQSGAGTLNPAARFT